MFRKTIFILFLLAFGSLGAQQVAKLRIVDANDSLPVPYAVVYFPEINKSYLADSNGFVLTKWIPGTTQKMIVSRVGYITTTFEMTTTAQLNYPIQKGTSELNCVQIIGTQTQLTNQSTSEAATVNQREMRSHGAFSISDGVSRLPGVTQLNTGIGISKPVIRGLYGNRIQTIVMGMRFDNQQWQDEHGLGLADIGIDRVHVIKGPMSLVYGSEALGGVLNVIEEKPALNDSVSGDVSFRAFSNTYGASLDAGVKVSKMKSYWRLRAGTESHADYSDGNNKRIQNSRFDGHVAKATLGFHGGHWSCEHNYLFSKSDFGFIMDTSAYLVPDGRLERGFDNPHHTVYINLYTMQNTFYLTRGLLRVNLGLHVNRRMEDEGGSGVSLDMRLTTASLHLQHERKIGKKWLILNGIQCQYQVNENLGWRIMVPDADLAEASVYSFFRYLSRNEEPFVFESGIRVDLRSVSTRGNNNPALGMYSIPAVQRTYSAVNGSAGVSVPMAGVITYRLNLTSGYRSPNLSELSSCGVHEGTLRFEIGNPDMDIEQNVCGEAAVELEYSGLNLSVAGYYNLFRNYIYLVPTNEEWFGFRVYRFIQTDAILHGTEITFEYTPEFFKHITLEANYAAIRATTGEQTYLPFIPSDKVQSNITYSFSDSGKREGVYVRAGVQHYFPQSHPAQFETPTNGYALFDAGAGMTFKLNKSRTLDLDLAGNNLLNKVYYDHLARFKEFNIYNIGRNITLNLKYTW